MKLKNYLKIGTVVQLIIIGIRLGSGKVKKYWTDVSEDYKRSSIFWISFILTMIIGAIINIILWPISIVVEIFNTKHGI